MKPRPQLYDFQNIFDRDPDIEVPIFGGFEELIRDIWDGKVTPSNLPDSLFNFTFDALIVHLAKMFGLPTDFDNGSIRQKRARAAKVNLGLFSGAKTFQEVLELSLAVFTDDGEIRPFDEFLQIGQKIDRRYNVDWLRTEQNAAFRQSQSIEAWQTIQETKDLFPLLKYSTVGDDRVRQEHRELDNIVRPVDDAFWNEWFPPNGYNCRCIVLQLETGEITPVRKEFDINDDPNFGTNVGKNGFIFPKTHPYFDIPEDYREDSRDNFGFIIPSDKDIKDLLDDKD